MPQLESLTISDRCFQKCKNAVIEGLPLLKSKNMKIGENCLVNAVCVVKKGTVAAGVISKLESLKNGCSVIVIEWSVCCIRISIPCLLNRSDG